MADQWFTYANAAAALGMSVEGVRQRARREHWRRQIGNDGKALILVPEDTPRSSAGDMPGNPSDERPVTPRLPPAKPGEVEVLQARIAELRTDLERERAERDRERTERLAERDRADRLSTELSEQGKRLMSMVDELRELSSLREQLSASKVWSQETQDRHVVELRDLQTRLEKEANQARDELAAFKARPWWRRLAG